jgi:hypothetical protein
VQVSPATCAPRCCAASISAAAAAHVTWTTKSDAPVYSAMRAARPVASASTISGRVSAWWTAEVSPFASARLTSRSTMSPFSAWTMMSAPRSRARSIAAASSSSRTMSSPL